MKKFIIAMLASVTMFMSGCNWNETAVTTTATTAGQIAMLTWFSIDNPDPAVKTVLKDVVGKITTVSVDVESGKTYLDTVLPVVQDIIVKQDKLNDYQKTLINAGAVVILNGIDTFLATNEKVKKDTELLNKVVGAFAKGCLSVLNMPEDCPECRNAKKVYATRSLKCRGGKFVAAPETK